MTPDPVSPACVVCEHGEGDHVMAESAVEFKRRGDYCLRCGAFCKAAVR